MTVRSRQQIIRSLISRAEESGRGWQMRETIRNLFEKVARQFQPHEQAVNDAMANDDTARSIRALNLLAEKEGLEVRFFDNAGVNCTPESSFRFH